jgi:hypothetical protein
MGAVLMVALEKPASVAPTGFGGRVLSPLGGTLIHRVDGLKKVTLY